MRPVFLVVGCALVWVAMLVANLSTIASVVVLLGTAAAIPSYEGWQRRRLDRRLALSHRTWVARAILQEAEAAGGSLTRAHVMARFLAGEGGTTIATLDSVLDELEAHGLCVRDAGEITGRELLRFPGLGVDGVPQLPASAVGRS